MRRPRLALLLACLLVAVSGCRSELDVSAESATEHGSMAIDGLSASEIIQQVLASYCDANAYSDEARLQLSYRLQNRFLEETHLWSVQYARPGRLAASIYNARLKSDGSHLSCFIFDFDSGNLDNQHVRLQLGAKQSLNEALGRLHEDSIGRHFLTGQAELPIDEQREPTQNVFFPPTIDMLTGRVPAWMTTENVQRLPDETLGRVACYKLRLHSSGLNYHMWIDRENFLLRQIEYPAGLLDPRLQSDPQVMDLKLLARFEKADLGAAADSDFSVQLPSGAKTVNHFVKVPESFPSGFIGKTIPAMGLQTPTGELVNRSRWRGKVALLAWTTDQRSDQPAKALIETLATEFSNKEFLLAHVIVTPAGFLSGRSDNPEWDALLAELHQDALVDVAFAGGQALGLKDYPVLAVVDREGVLQYVSTDEVGNALLDELRSVLLRVRSGDDVAAEMRSEYETFLEEYHSRLVAAGEGQELISSAAVRADSPGHLVTNRLWTCNEVNQPGNLVCVPSATGSRLLVIDGYRTIVELDLDGQVLRKKELALAPGEAVTILRAELDPIDGLRVAAFSRSGQNVHVLDEDFRTIQQYPTRPAIDVQIQDAHLFDYDLDGRLELWVLETNAAGIDIVDIRSGSILSSIETPEARLFTHLGEGPSGPAVFFADALGNSYAMQAPGRITANPVGFTAITGLGLGRSADSRACLIGSREDGAWSAAGIGSKGEETWSASIGEQSFGSQIQSASFAKIPGPTSGIWAIAASDDHIHFLQDDGVVQDRWNYGRPITGISLVADGQRLLLIVCSAGQVEAWSLSTTVPINQRRSPTDPTSRAPETDRPVR